MIIIYCFHNFQVFVLRETLYAETVGVSGCNSNGPQQANYGDVHRGEVQWGEYAPPPTAINSY